MIPFNLVQQGEILFTLAAAKSLGEDLKSFDRLVGRWKMKYLDIEWKETVKV